MPHGLRQRTRERNRIRQERRANRKERERRERQLQSIIDNDAAPTNNNTDIFQDVLNYNPFDEPEINEVIQEMQLDYNMTSEQKRQRTFNERFGASENDYDIITNVLGSEIYQLLKESGYLDSAQIIDEITSFDFGLSPQLVERALLDLISDINSVETSNIRLIKQAMDLGFSLEDAIYLTENDLQQEIEPAQGIVELRDRIMQQLELTEQQNSLMSELRERERDYRQ